MKALVVLISVLVSAPAFAGGFADYQRILFQSASTFVPANKVCVRGGNLYHKTKATISVDYCDDNNQNCVTKVMPLVQPMASTRVMCLKYGKHPDTCVKSKVVAFNQGPSASVTYYSSQKDWEENRSPIGGEVFMLPACTRE